MKGDVRGGRCKPFNFSGPIDFPLLYYENYKSIFFAGICELYSKCGVTYMKDLR